MESGGRHVGLVSDPQSDEARLATGRQHSVADSHPIAVYAGHQFGRYNPQLGDGAHCSGMANTLGARFDIRLKGTGPTTTPRAVRALPISCDPWYLGLNHARSVSRPGHSPPSPPVNPSSETRSNLAPLDQVAGNHLRSAPCSTSARGRR